MALKVKFYDDDADENLNNLTLFYLDNDKRDRLFIPTIGVGIYETREPSCRDICISLNLRCFC